MIETGIFHNRHDAEEAVRLLRKLGYRDDEISVIVARESEAGIDGGGIVIGVTRVAREEELIPPRRYVL